MGMQMESGGTAAFLWLSDVGVQLPEKDFQKINIRANIHSDKHQ